MNLSFTLRRATLLLALTLPSFCWGFGPSKNALVVTNTGPYQTDIDDVVTFLSGRLVSAGFAVTTSVGVPGGLSSYNEVWDVRFYTPLSGPDLTAYESYLSGGGALFTMGENGTCCTPRDASIVALIAAVGGGAVTLETNSANTQTVQSPFTGPVTLATLTYADVGGFTAPGKGAFITEDTPTTGGAIIFGPGTMSGATTGALASVLDINFMDTNNGGVGLNQALTDNLIAYLAAPTAIPLPGTPAPPTLLLMLLGLGAMGMYFTYREWQT